MDWKDFIKPIRAQHMVAGSAESIVLDLFDIAGCITPPSSETVHSWIYGKRGSECRSRAYFPEGVADAEAVFRYFSNKPNDTLHCLQKKFEEQMTPDSGSPIDVKTKDLDIFCWSLVNQFLDLLKFERVDIPQPKGDIPSTRKDLSPHNRKCCLYCAYWSGNRGIIGVSTMPTDGKCCVQKSDNKFYVRGRLSSTAACANYRADQALMSRMKEYGYNIEELI